MPLRLLLEGQGVSKPYSQHSVVYSCISAIATNISQVPFVLYEKKGEREEPLEADHPLVKVFVKPNPLMVSSDLWEATAIWYCLKGEAIWIVERQNPTQLPREIWIFNPDRFRIITDDRTGLPIGWEYQGKQKIGFALHEIVFFRAYNPYDDLRGMSPIQAAAAGIDQDYWASKYNEAFFRNDATPGTVISVPGELTDEQYQRLKQQWEERHAGAEKAHRVAILEGGAKVDRVGLSHKDMDFLQQRKWNREEIMMVFKVPKHVLSIYEDLRTYAGIRVIDKGFWQQCLIPKMKYFEAVLYANLLQYLEGGDIRGKFDLSGVEALAEDFDKKLESAERLYRMGYPINAINQKLNLGMPEVPWGDVWWAPWNITPIYQRPAEGGKEKAKIKISADRADEIWRAYLRLHAPHEQRMARKIKRYFFEQRQRVLKALFELLGKEIKDIKDYADDIFDTNKENEILKVLVKELLLDAMREGVESLADELGIEISFDPTHPDAARYLEKKLIQITRINDTVKEQIRQAIRQGLAEGDTTQEIADRIRKVYNFAANRATTIARTETGSAVNGARYHFARQHGAVLHTWITAGDEHVRPSHQACNGVTVKVGEKFPNGLRFPNDPNGPPEEVINCRCLCIYSKI